MPACRGVMTLIRTPMLSQVERVVANADVSFNTELEVIAKLSSAAQMAGRSHGIVLMLELGDLREGVLPGDLERTVRQVLRFPNIALRGLGTNLACRSGVAPNAGNMSELSGLVESIEETFGLTLDIVSGGNSANLNWALGDNNVGRINDLRLGESLLLGCETLHRRPIEGLHTDAFTFIAEVIESKVKPTGVRGDVAQTAFGDPVTTKDRGNIRQAILAVGRQDVDPGGLHPLSGIEVLAASSDHLVVDGGNSRLVVGTEVKFRPNYSSLLRSMTSPFVTRSWCELPPGCARVWSEKNRPEEESTRNVPVLIGRKEEESTRNVPVLIGRTAFVATAVRKKRRDATRNP